MMQEERLGFLYIIFAALVVYFHFAELKNQVDHAKKVSLVLREFPAMFNCDYLVLP